MSNFDFISLAALFMLIKNFFTVSFYIFTVREVMCRKEDANVRIERQTSKQTWPS